MREYEKFEYIHSLGVDKEVLEYLKERLTNLNINILGQRKGHILELMAKGYLEGWCWQTTESAIIFLKDRDYIERGYLNLDESKEPYYHSWICFNYNKKKYVLDACLNVLCDYDVYHDLFEIKKSGYVYAYQVKEELIRQVLNYKPKERKYDMFKSVFKDKYDEIMKDYKDEVKLHAPEDPFTPLYRNNSGYKATIEDNKIRKLNVHYYY